MIKVNLLDSVTDRTRSVAAVEARVANPRARSWMLMGVVFGLTVLAMGVDYVSAEYNNRAMKQELAVQEEVSKKMKEINLQQAELEKKINEVKTRIEAIKMLRASQQGPVSILSEINSRLPSVQNFALASVEQKNGQLTIEGHSPNEDVVTQFARTLEFSSNIFTDVSIETERKLVELSDTEWTVADGEIDPDAPRPEVVKFKITGKYGQREAKAAAPGQTTAAAPSQVAQK